MRRGRKAQPTVDIGSPVEHSMVAYDGFEEEEDAARSFDEDNEDRPLAVK
jgi:hypothetical protein